MTLIQLQAASSPRQERLAWKTETRPSCPGRGRRGAPSTSREDRPGRRTSPSTRLRAMRKVSRVLTRGVKPALDPEIPARGSAQCQIRLHHCEDLRYNEVDILGKSRYSADSVTGNKTIGSDKKVIFTHDIINGSIRCGRDG